MCALYFFISFNTFIKNKIPHTISITKTIIKNLPIITNQSSVPLVTIKLNIIIIANKLSATAKNKSIIKDFLNCRFIFFPPNFNINSKLISCNIAN